jgi:DNA-binding transcriptional LysR family regulator
MGDPKFEIRHLRYVIAAAEQGSFRRAAVALGVRESSISRRIRNLEDEIGASLFIRSWSGVCLTYAGHRFVRRARRAISQIRFAATDANAIGRGEDGEVRIGIFSSIASGFLTELFHAYEVDHPSVQLDFIEGGSGDHLAAIRQHRLDVAFLTGSPSADGCDIAHLWNERVYVVMPEKHELADREEIEWENLRFRHFVVSETPPGPEIHDFLVKHLSELGYRPNIRQQGVYRDTLMQIVANGRGLTLTSEATTAARFPGVTYRPLRGEVLPFCAVWSPRNDNPAFRRLLSLAKSISRRCATCLIMNGRSGLSEPADSAERSPVAPSRIPDR